MREVPWAVRVKLVKGRAAIDAPTDARRIRILTGEVTGNSEDDWDVEVDTEEEDEERDGRTGVKGTGAVDVIGCRWLAPTLVLTKSFCSEGMADDPPRGCG